MSDESSFLLDEATTLIKSNLHALLNNFNDWNQILCYGRYMQEIVYVCLFAFFAKWDIAYVLYRMSDIISGLDIDGSIRILRVLEPFLMRRCREENRPQAQSVHKRVRTGPSHMCDRRCR